MTQRPKDTMIHQHNRGSASIIGLLLALAIMCILFFLFSQYNSRPSFDAPLKKSLETHEIDTSSYESILESTKVKLKGIEQKQMEISNILLK